VSPDSLVGCCLHLQGETFSEARKQLVHGTCQRH
jgi:hypothetical protein